MAEKIVLPRGTIEHLIVDVRDRMANISDLDGLGSRFDVRAKGSAAWLVQDEPASTVGMTAYCLVDTTAYTSQRYELFLQFDNLPESPRLGPFEFEVNA